MDSVFNNNVCRLCLWESVACIPIFSENGGESIISRRILALLQIAVSQDDAFPKVICHACVYKLEMFNNFQANCVQCDNMLKSYIGPAHIHTTAPVQTIVGQVAPVVEEEPQETVKVEVVDWMEETEQQQEPNTTVITEAFPTLHQEPSTSTAHEVVYTTPHQPSSSATLPLLQDSKREPQSSVTRHQSTCREDQIAETDPILESSVDSRTTRMQERTSSAQVKSVETNGSGMVSSSCIGLKKRHHVCKFCKRRFKSSYHLSKHHSSKHSQKNFICEYCDKAFSHLQLLTSHKAIHLEYKYSCQVCFKKFNSLSSLKYHVEHKCVTAAISNDHRYASHANPAEMEEDVEQGSFIKADFGQTCTKTEATDPETTLELNKEETHCDLCGLDFKNRQGLGRHKTGNYHNNREAVLKSHERRKVAALKATNRKAKLCKLVKKDTAQSMAGLKASRLKKAKQLANIRAKRALKTQLTKQSKFKHLSSFEKWKHIDTPCDVCGKVFVSLVGMYIHRTVAHGKKTA